MAIGLLVFCWTMAQGWEPILSREKDNIKAPWEMRRWLWLGRLLPVGTMIGHACAPP